MGAIFEHARGHGVLAIVWRKLRGAARREGRGETFRAEVERLETEHTFTVGRAMLLRHHAARIGERLRERAIPAEIVKGPVFADRLYAHTSDRTFTDIDLLADPSDLDGIGAALADCGFELHEKVWDNSARYLEYKWFLKGNPNLMVEAQGDLVHYPALRRRLSFGYTQLKAVSPDTEPSPAGMLLVAAIHALGGHKFHRLQFAVDLLQAARHVTDEDALVQAVGRVGAELEVGAALHVTAALFGDGRTAALAARFPAGRRGALGRRLLGVDAVLEAAPRTSRASHLRRHGFRWLQLLD
nr:nucleotidyltransferase family protein [Ancylobacter koreensis]